MRRDHRSLSDLEHIIECAVRHMRDVYHNSYTIHFCNNLFAKWTESIPGVGCVIWWITDLVVFSVGQGNVAYTPIVEIFYIIKIIADWCPVFHPHRQGYFSFYKVLFNIRWCPGKSKFIGIRFCNSLDHVDQRISEYLTMIRPLLIFGWNIHWHERSIETSFFCSFIVKISLGGTDRYAQIFAIKAKFYYTQAIGQINMAIGNYDSVSKWIGLVA